MTRFSSGYVMGIAFFTCAITALLGGKMFAASPRGPVAAVVGVQQAIDASDMAMLSRYIDLDGVLNKAVTVAVADASVREATARYPAAALVLAVGGEGRGDALRVILEGEIKEYIRYGVSSGAFAGAPKPGASAYRGLFGSVFRGGTRDKVTILSPVVTQKDANEALVTATATYGGKDETYPLTLRVRKETDIWRVVDITNMPDLVRRSIGK